MRDDQAYKIIKLAAVSLGKLPRPILKFFADGLGLIWFCLDKRHRDVAIENVQKAFPGEFSKTRARQFVKRNFMHTIGIAFEVIWSYSKTPEELFTYFSWEGRENLDAALAKGRGVIGLTCHMSTFEFMVIGMALMGNDPYVLYRRLDYPPLERLTKEMRQRFGAVMIPVRNASRNIEAVLGKGHFVATLLDQNVDWYQGVFVDFFGRPACTHKSLAKMAMRSKTAVVPGFIRREGQRYIVQAFPEIEIENTGDNIKDIENNTQKFRVAIEHMVRKCPEQYFWVHNQWKTKSYCRLPG